MAYRPRPVTAVPGGPAASTKARSKPVAQGFSPASGSPKGLRYVGFETGSRVLARYNF
jgi:hypothetical protein